MQRIGWFNPSVFASQMEAWFEAVRSIMTVLQEEEHLATFEEVMEVMEYAFRTIVSDAADVSGYADGDVILQRWNDFIWGFRANLVMEPHGIKENIMSRYSEMADQKLQELLTPYMEEEDD